MTFEELLDQAIALLQRRGRLTYRALKRQFNLDDDYLEDLKAELITGQRLAVDEGGAVLIWTGDTASGVTDAAAPTIAPVPLTYTPPYLAEKILAARAALQGERKQVTVLFADLKGSMELLDGLDPEEARALLDPALHVMMEAVHRYEGTVNQVLGDGIMALFGAPVAHEDHAVRACYAALAMQSAMRRYAEDVRRSHGLEMQIRVGLNAGAVVVRAIGNDLHMDYSAIGQTTHLAARMEQLATPGSIRLTAATLRLVEGLIQVNALGPFPVKGLSHPVEVFELLGASTIRRRLQASAARGLTRFVGRQQELTILQQTLQRAGAGHGQVVAVVGEAGVGKSRLVYEFVHSHHTPGWLVLESASVSYGKATPYFPVIDLLKRYSHVEEHDDTRTIRAKVTGQVLTLDAALQDTIPALLSLLDALPDDSPFAQLDPPQRRQHTIEALKRVLLRESQVQPLLLVCEDLHWIDAETQALLNSLVESLPTARLLLLTNYRPEYQHGWGSKTYYTQLRLDPLPPGNADEFLHALLGDDPGLEPLKKLLIARTEGNPFFLEESVHTLVEIGALLGAPGAYRLTQSLPTIQVPATVQAMLAARIDRLQPEDKHLLQIGAVIGHEVSFPLLLAIAELPEADVQRGLARLQAAEFLYETRLFPERELTFKHALTHEVAYESLLQERRRALHARIVAALEAFAPDRLAEQMERLASHAMRGAVWDKALLYCWQAGARAVSRSAYREAVAYFEQALTALAQLPECRDTLEQAIDLRFALRNAFLVLGENERLPQHLRAAESLAQRLGDQHRLGQVSAYLGAYFHTTGDYDQAITAYQRTIVTSAALGESALQVQVTLMQGITYYVLGDYHRAIDCFSSNVAFLVGERSQELFGLAGFPSVFSHNHLALCLLDLGSFDEGRVHVEEAIRMAEAVSQPFSLTVAYHGAGVLALRQGDLPTAIPLLEHGLGFCQGGDVSYCFPALALALVVAYALYGRVAEALPLLEQAMSLSTMRWPLYVSPFLWTAEASLLAGRLEEATTAACRAFERASISKERGYQAHAYRLLGEIATRRDPPDIEQAATHYSQALELAEALGMRPLQAHCQRGLGILYTRTGQWQQARTALSTAIDLYRAMDMTFWLPQTEEALRRVENNHGR